MHDSQKYLAPLSLLLGVVVVASRRAAGELALPVVTLEQLLIVAGLLVGFFAHFLVVAAVVSIIRARHFRDPVNGRVDVRAVWGSLTVKPVVCSLGVVGFLVGVMACGNLVEIYRTQPRVWQDPVLWDLERGLFATLLASPLNAPAFWDTVYFWMWRGLLLGSSLLIVTGRAPAFFLLLNALVWAFVLTRVAALYYPSQGPAFFVPGMFDLSGTVSADMQGMLARYMSGEVNQNGLLPGTMAMPSLHVAMPFLVSLLVARAFPWSLWLTVPWFVLNWASTVFLGWHYALDGVGGVAIALVALGLARVQQWAWDSLLGFVPVGDPAPRAPTR